MSQSATVPTHQHHIAGKHVPEPNDPLQTQSLEDQLLAERVQHALHSRGNFALYAVRVSVRARAIFLEGRVPSYYLKQLAQETARAASGAYQIRNDLNVVQLEENYQEGDALQRQPHVRFSVSSVEQSGDTKEDWHSRDGGRP